MVIVFLVQVFVGERRGFPTVLPGPRGVRAVLRDFSGLLRFLPRPRTWVCVCGCLRLRQGQTRTCLLQPVYVASRVGMGVDMSTGNGFRDVPDNVSKQALGLARARTPHPSTKLNM